MTDSDFELKISKGYRLFTVNILYYMPDHTSLVQEFLWQTLDMKPRLPRIHKFLKFWKDEIDAVIKEVQIFDDLSLNSNNIKFIDKEFKYKN